MNKKTLLLTTILLLNSFACRQQEKTADELVTVLETHTGIASYYGIGDGFAGKTMANGKPMDPYALTAAHRTWRMGTIVRIIHTDKNNHQKDSVTVEITDRGPFTKNKAGNYTRSFDLSYAAAEKLGFVEQGYASVTAEVLKRGKKPKKKKSK